MPKRKVPALSPSPSPNKKVKVTNEAPATAATTAAATTTTRVALSVVISGIANPLGIGRHLVRAFLEQGWVVGAVDINPMTDPTSRKDLKQLNELAVANRGAFAFAPLDVTNAAAVEVCLAELFDALSIDKVTCLINNAAIASPYLPTAGGVTARVAAFRRFIDVNLTGAFIMSEFCLPFMSTGGSIVHISSTRAKMSEPNSEGYGASKAGLLGLTHAQAVSLADRQIRVNCVLPGWIDVGTYPPSENDHTFHPAGRVGQTNDIAQICLFLADSSKAGFVTGQEFVVDGGVTKKMFYPDD